MYPLRKPWAGYGSLLFRELTSSVSLADPRDLRLGFSTESRRMYGIEGAAADAYLSDTEAVRSRSIVGEPWRTVFASRDALHNAVAERGFGQYLPEVIGVIAGRLLRMPNGRGGWADHPIEALWDVVALHGGAMLRPIYTRNGGVMILRSVSGSVWIDNRPFVPTEAEHRIQQMPGALVSPLVPPHSEITLLHPGTLNSTRVLTAWPTSFTEPALAEPCLQHIGTLGTAPLAGWRDGALVCRVDREEGVLSPALQLQRDLRPLAWDAHPTSGEHLTGKRVPHWQEIKALACALARAFPDIPYAMWEFLAHEDGPVLLDATCRPDAQPFQAHAPLLEDPALTELYREYRILDIGRRRLRPERAEGALTAGMR